VIVGGYTKDDVRHGYVLVDRAVHDVGCARMFVADCRWSYDVHHTRKINDAGQIVGFYGAGGNIVRGFLATTQ